MEQNRDRNEELRPLIARFLAIVALAFIAAVALFFAGRAQALEVDAFGNVGDGNWRRCAGSACWDQSGDEAFPLPVKFKTRSTTLELGARAGEVQISLAYFGPGKNVVEGDFVKDEYFDARTRKVIGCPDMVVHSTVDQWTWGARLVWAPRWSFDGFHLQPELGAFAARTRWAINWTAPYQARADGAGWSVTPSGGARVLFDAPGRMKIDVGVEIFHKPTTINAPLGGGGKKGPGLVVTTVGVRY